VPEPLIKKVGTKIMDLQNPTSKMSKSSENPKGVIRLLDDLAVTRKKIMSATTDSEMSVKFDMENKPGISNLINIYASLTGKEIPEIESEFEGCNYGTFKTKVADVVVSELEKIQNKYNEVINSKYLDDILDAGTEKMKEVFKTKYDDMKKKIGLSR
jgi:tryptophanyl-tRNA synthetase